MGGAFTGLTQIRDAPQGSAQIVLALPYSRRKGNRAHHASHFSQSRSEICRDQTRESLKVRGGTRPRLDAMEIVLATLREIPGVVGSFVLSPTGTLLARKMPDIFPDSVFPELAQHLQSVNNTLHALIRPSRELVLKFDDHRLFIWRAAECFLCVLTAPGANLPALKLAAKGAHQQLADHLAGRSITQPTTRAGEWRDAERMMA